MDDSVYTYLLNTSQVLVVAGNAEVITRANIYEVVAMLQIDINMICIRSLTPHKNLENTFNIAILQIRKLRHGVDKQFAQGHSRRVAHEFGTLTLGPLYSITSSVGSRSRFWKYILELR